MLLTESKRHQFCKEAIELKKDIEVDFLSLGAMLYTIQKERYFEAGWESWDTFTMELKMSAATISRLINIYEVFRLRFGIGENKMALAGGWSVVAEYLPLVSDKTTKDEVVGWFDAASHLSRTDVRRTILEAKTGVSMADCKHPNAYLLRVCPDCRVKEKVYGEEE